MSTWHSHRLPPDASAFSRALKPFNLHLARRSEVISDLSDAALANAYLCRNNDHWFGLRRIGAHWLNLNHAMQRPAQLSAEHLGVCLKQLEDDGHDIYVVQGDLPRCEADSDPLYEAYFDWGLIGGLFLSSGGQLDEYDPYDDDFLDDEDYDMYDDPTYARGKRKIAGDEDDFDDGYSSHTRRKSQYYAAAASSSSAAASSTSYGPKGLMYTEPTSSWRDISSSAPLDHNGTRGDELDGWNSEVNDYRRLLECSENEKFQDDLQAAIRASLDDQAANTASIKLTGREHSTHSLDHREYSEGAGPSYHSSSSSHSKRSREYSPSRAEEDEQLAAAMSSRLCATFSHTASSSDHQSSASDDKTTKCMSSNLGDGNNEENSADSLVACPKRPTASNRDDAVVEMQIATKAETLARQNDELPS